MPHPKRKILVTSALPYANGAIHIGHLVEYIQTDIWVRYQRLCGHQVVYVCGDDAHGTPIMLRARKEGLSPEDFIGRMNLEHQRDFARFDIAFDSYYSTHSTENQALCVHIYEILRKNGHIVTRDVEQFFDPMEQIFLPDRFIRGTCPNCKAPDQYGDSCEICGKHYQPTDLINPRSAVSGAIPVRKTSRHFFLRLEHFRQQLQNLLQTRFVDESVANKLREWFTTELKDWDISRDAPFFGFAIPDEADKYFYNWLDAPIGYLASLAHYLAAPAEDAIQFWQNDDLEVHHFIGKDIVYFHALFWPAMLFGAGLRPPTKLAVHGHLTVNAEKMSKSRGTFISALQYARYLDPQWLRYYFATRLTTAPSDLDLSFEDFTARVNSELVGKLANLISRAAPMLNRLLNGETGVPVVDALPLLEQLRQAKPEIAQAFEERNFAGATRQICSLADKANKFVEDNAPWVLVKTDAQAARGVLTAALEAGRILTIYLKAIVPQFARSVEQCLNIAPLEWQHIEDSMPAHKINAFVHLATRVDDKAVQSLIQENMMSEPTAVTPPSVIPPTPSTATSSSSNPSPAGPGSVEPLAPTCTIEQFAAVDLRVARVISAEDLPGSDKLLKLQLDAGALGHRVVLAGIKKAIALDQLPGRLVIFCANLAPRKMKLGTSEGMVLASGPGGTEVFLLSVDSRATPGQRVH
jgi:methionyl-tRNA synthetase